MSDQTSPVGILDSGIGGFSVAKQVQRLLPRENLLYFGDGAHIPYGNHAREDIVAMARYMFRFMEERGVKALLVACNTISCVLDRRADEISCPVFSAVQAGAEAAARLEDPMPREEKLANFNRLTALQDVISEEKHAAYVGKTVRCLLDGLSDDERYDLTARTPGNRLVRVVGDPAALGRFRDVKITGANKWSLFGELI